MAIHETITPSHAVDTTPLPASIRVVATQGYDAPANDTQLVALACAVGAAACGGPLSRGERSLVTAARRERGVLAAVIDATRTAIAAGHDPLGDLYYRLHPADTRRATGTFYTPPSIVSSMATRDLPTGPGRDGRCAILVSGYGLSKGCS